MPCDEQAYRFIKVFIFGFHTFMTTAELRDMKASIRIKRAADGA
jgi:hypothetical protein